MLLPAAPIVTATFACPWLFSDICVLFVASIIMDVAHLFIIFIRNQCIRFVVVRISESASIRQCCIRLAVPDYYLITLQFYWMRHRTPIMLRCCHQPNGNAWNSRSIRRDSMDVLRGDIHSHVTSRTLPLARVCLCVCVALINLFVRKSEVHRRARLLKLISQEFNRIKSTVKWQTETFEIRNSILIRCEGKRTNEIDFSKHKIYLRLRGENSIHTFGEREGKMFLQSDESLHIHNFDLKEFSNSLQRVAGASKVRAINCCRIALLNDIENRVSHRHRIFVCRSSHQQFYYYFTWINLNFNDLFSDCFTTHMRWWWVGKTIQFNFVLVRENVAPSRAEKTKDSLK